MTSMTDEKGTEQGKVSPFPAMEEEVAEHWRKHHIFERSIEERPEAKGYVFYDGPPFATGLPHYGHLLQSAIKDAVPRYWTMKGYRVPRRWGWDCHGLPIENLIEKDLKLESRKAIEAYGIDKFNAACRLSVFGYEKEWGKYIDRLGRWVDFEDSYKTMDDKYIESVWWVFSELHKKGYVYKSKRVSLYCPRCSTPLSNFEISMGNSYAEHDDPAVYVKFPVVGKEKTFFLAWTTTPWTLPANTGLAVHPDLMYVAVALEETGETLIFAESRQSDVLKQHYPLKSGGVPFEVVGRWKGSELLGQTYEPLFTLFPVENAYRIVTGEHVTAHDGTGIVHTAPAFGEDDLAVAKQHKLPMIESVDDTGMLVEACGPFAGLTTKEANKPILEDLEARHLLYRSERITHSVPICWRCSTLLLYRAQPAWFVDVTKLRPKLLKTAQKINWHPEGFKDGRFGKGLESAPDWNISRTRYWGSPIPVWACGECDKMTIIGSIAELKKRAKPETWPEKVDLHRPGIDQVVLSCPCGGEQRRIPEVFDCWLESGSMPTATLHYPFENKKWFEGNFPADFIGEAQDQTRGWFFTLHVLATALFNKPAFKNVIVTGLILAEDGKKMSKSLKNYPDPWSVLTTYGADALRYYLLSSPVVEADALNFSERDLQNVMRGLINLFWNVKTFYATYATDDVKLEKPRSAHVLDRWLLARFMQTLAHVTEEMDMYELGHATRPMRVFIDDLSTWWLRRSRERMKSDNAYERLDALKTLREVLEETAKLMAPITPFIAEKVYLDIGGPKASVHLERWSKADERLIDQKLLDDMTWVRDVCSRAHEQRASAKLPVRQALKAVVIRLAEADEAERLSRQQDLLTLIKDELNVLEVRLEVKAGMEQPMETELDVELTPELIRLGHRREFTRHVMQLRKGAGLSPTDSIRLRFATKAESLAGIALDPAVAKDLRITETEQMDDLPDGVEPITIGGEEIRCDIERLS